MTTTTASDYLVLPTADGGVTRLTAAEYLALTDPTKGALSIRSLTTVARASEYLAHFDSEESRSFSSIRERLGVSPESKPSGSELKALSSLLRAGLITRQGVRSGARYRRVR